MKIINDNQLLLILMKAFSGTLGHHPFVLKMIYIYNYYTGFMVLGSMVCITIGLLSTIVSLRISIFRKFSKYHYCLLKFVYKIRNNKKMSHIRSNNHVSFKIKHFCKPIANTLNIILYEFIVSYNIFWQTDKHIGLGLIVRLKCASYCPFYTQIISIIVFLC